MKRWRSVKIMMLALVALFLPAYALPAFCCASLLAPQSDSHTDMPIMACCLQQKQAASSATLQCALHEKSHEVMHNCCCKPSPKSPQPGPRDANLPAAGTRSIFSQLDDHRVASGPQYVSTLLIFAPLVLMPHPQISERNFQIVSPLCSLDKSPPAPGRAPPIL